MLHITIKTSVTKLVELLNLDEAALMIIVNNDTAQLAPGTPTRPNTHTDDNCGCTVVEEQDVLLKLMCRCTEKFHTSVTTKISQLCHRLNL